MNTRRPLLLPALLLLNVFLLAAFAAVVWFDNAVNRGIAFTPEPEPLGTSPALGVNLFNVHLEPDRDAVRRSFALTAAMGARYARMQVPWDDLEIHARGDFEDRRNLQTVGAVSAWAKYDYIVAEANAAGVALIMRLDRPPAWARQAAASTPAFQEGLQRDGNSTGPPDDYADYARFVGTVVERYDADGVADAPGSPVVRHFQLWNEPNLKNEWNWQEPQPEQFVELLRVGATAARAASPDTIILFPGLAPTDGLDRRAPMTELEYLDRVYKAGGGSYFDIMAAQSYGLGQPPDEHRYVFLRGRDNWSWRRPIDTRNDVSRVVLLREVMEANGDTATPIWITEFGWNSAPESVPPERRFTWGEPVSEETKGAYLVGQLERARVEWPWMGVMNVWMLRYGGYAEPDPADPTPYFALVTRDWQTLPAFDALRTYTADPPPATTLTRSWPWLWDYGPLGLLLLMALVGGLTVGQLLPALDALRARITLAQAHARGRRGLMARLIQPDSLIVIGMVVGVAVAYRASAQLPLTLAGLVLFGALALARPGLALMVVPLTVPLYFIPKGLFDARFGIRDSGIYLPLHEIVLVVAAVAVVVRVLVGYARPGDDLARDALARDVRPGDARSGDDLARDALARDVRPGDDLARDALARDVRPGDALARDARSGDARSGDAFPRDARPGDAFPRDARPGDARSGDARSGDARSGDALPGRLYAWLATVGLFVGASVWGVVIAEARGQALREFRWMIVGPLVFVGLVWLWQHYEARRDHPATNYWLLASGFWLVGGAVAGLVGVLQFLGLNLVPLFGTKAGFSEDSFLVEGVRRVAGLYGHPNNLGLAMGRYWPVAAALAHAAFWGATTRSVGMRQAWPYMLVTGLCLGGLLVSFSRGAYLGAAAAAVVLAVTLLPAPLWRTRRVLVPLAVLVMVGLGAATVVVALDIERFNPFGASSGIRLQTWASALAMLRDHPLGIGLDQFGRLYPQYIAPNLAGTNEINTAHPHNLILDIALRMGPLGLVAFTWLIVRFYADVRAGLTAGDTRRPLYAGLAAAMTGALVHGMVDQFYFWPDLAFAFWIFVALAGGARLARRP